MWGGKERGRHRTLYESLRGIEVSPLLSFCPTSIGFPPAHCFLEPNPKLRSLEMNRVSWFRPDRAPVERGLESGVCRAYGTQEKRSSDWLLFLALICHTAAVEQRRVRDRQPLVILSVAKNLA